MMCDAIKFAEERLKELKRFIPQEYHNLKHEAETAGGQGQGRKIGDRI
jgi:hypothetical protein